MTEAVSLGELLHEEALLVLPGGSTPRTLIPVWTLLVRHISSSLSVARPYTNGVEKNVQTLWWAELDRLHSMTRAHPPLVNYLNIDLILVTMGSKPGEFTYYECSSMS